MIEQHRHKGTDSPSIDAGDLIGPAVITSNLAVSARRVQPALIQRGTHTLAGGTVFVGFPQPYPSTTELIIQLTSRTTNPQFIESFVVSGFTVSGSGADTGHWLAIGYK